MYMYTIYVCMKNMYLCIGHCLLFFRLRPTPPQANQLHKLTLHPPHINNQAWCNSNQQQSKMIDTPFPLCLQLCFYNEYQHM